MNVLSMQMAIVAENKERAEDAPRTELELWGLYGVLQWEDKGINDLLSYAGRFLPADRWLELSADCPGGFFFAPPLAFNNLARIDYSTLSALLPKWNRRRTLGPNFFMTTNVGSFRPSVRHGADPVWVIYKVDGQPPTRGPGEYLAR